jgi:hypothetical protein
MDLSSCEEKGSAKLALFRRTAERPEIVVMIPPRMGLGLDRSPDEVAVGLFAKSPYGRFKKAGRAWEFGKSALENGLGAFS